MKNGFHSAVYAMIHSTTIKKEGTMVSMNDKEAVKSGFKDFNELLNLVSGVDLNTPERLTRFGEWKNSDGTQKGLVAILTTQRHEDTLNQRMGRNAIDLMAGAYDKIELTIQSEVGFPDRFKVYVNINGVCFFRMCKLKATQIEVDGTSLLRKTRAKK